MTNSKFENSPNQSELLNVNPPPAPKNHSAGHDFEGSSTPCICLKICLYPFILEKYFRDPREYLSILNNLKYEGALDYLNSKRSSVVI